MNKINEEIKIKIKKESAEIVEVPKENLAVDLSAEEADLKFRHGRRDIFDRLW